MKPLTLETMNEIMSEKKKRLIFDIDGVIAIHPKDGKNYASRSKPDKELIELMRVARFQGHTIILFTARKMRSNNSNVGAVIADTGLETLKWLNKYQVPYDEIYFGKPFGHKYYDDLALNYNREDMIKDLKVLTIRFKQAGKA
jgi:capsule biosynthesis phosphatase